MKEGNPSFEPYEGEKPYIFVSYSHEDKEVINDLKMLNRQGFRIWYDKAIEIDTQWSKSIDDHLKACSAFMIFVSRNAVESDYVLEEVGMARDKKIPIIAVFLTQDADPGINYRVLLRRQGINKWDKSQNDYYYELVENLKRIASVTHEHEDPFDRDSKILGFDYLPTLKDVICDDNKSLKLEEQEKRRKKKVFDMHNCIPLIESYSINNVFQITSEVTQASHNLGELELLKTDHRKPTNLLSHPLNIGKVYVAPLRLVAGLITRLDENWPPLVASYKMLVQNSQLDRLDDLHYFIEFCWLAWGPSILTTSLLDQNNTFMVIQAAFGDEANSLPLIMKKAKWNSMEVKFKNRYYGWPVSLKNVIVVRPGSDRFFDEFQIDEYLFKDIFFDTNLADTKQVALYLPHDDDGYLEGEINTIISAQEACYSTAYVWLMLEQIDKEEVTTEGLRDITMKPGKVIPFFEHANLGTTKGLMFLQHCLARKAIYHILECEIDPEYKDKGYYRFATALFPDDMVKIIKMEIGKLKKKDKDILKKRFKIPEEEFWRSPLDVVNFADAVEKVIHCSCKQFIKETGACDSCDKCSFGGKYNVKEESISEVVV